MFASYGVSDRLDIGVAVPFVRVELNASVLRTNRPAGDVGRSRPFTRSRLQSGSATVPQLSGTAAGLGDMVLRGKYAFTADNPLGLAAAVEARVPTGDENNLLGTGGVQTKIFGIASLHRGPVLRT